MQTLFSTLRILLSILILLGSKNHFAMASSDSSTLQCAVDLCGPAREDINRMPTKATLSADVENQTQKEIDPMIDSLIDLQMKVQKVTFEALEPLMNQLNHSNLKPIEKAILNAGLIVSIFRVSSVMRPIFHS